MGITQGMSKTYVITRKEKARKNQESQNPPPPPKRGVGLCYSRLGLFYLRLVFVAYGKFVWSFLLTVEIGLVFVVYGEKVGLVFFTYGSLCP